MASQKIKAAKTRLHTSTPYNRPHLPQESKPKSFVQTVKDWLTPSKWTEKQSHMEGPSFDHTSWPGTPHPIQGNQLDDQGITHPLTTKMYWPEEKGVATPPSLITNRIMKDDSVPMLGGEEEISTDEQRSGIHQSSSPSTSYATHNGLKENTSSPPLLATVYDNKKELGPLKNKSNISGTRLTSTPNLSPKLPATTDLTNKSSLFHSHKSGNYTTTSSRPAFSLAAFTATSSPFTTTTSPMQTLTNLSLSRSPFRSSFYSGRTSFGGASSIRKHSTLSSRKRTRNDTSPTHNVSPVRRTIVKPTQASSSHFSSTGASHTALKILDTLQSLSTPLQDARKLPLKMATPAKKQRLEGGSANTSSSSPLSPPPPVSSLTTPSQAKRSQIKQPVVKIPLKISTTDDKVIIDLTTSPKQSSSPLRDHTPTSPAPYKSSGKIRATKHKTHYSSRKDSSSDTFNQTDIPPHIPLVLSSTGNKPLFDLPLPVPPTNAPPINIPRPPLVMISTASVVSKVTSAPGSESSYSFTSPKVYDTGPRPQQTTPTGPGRFQFSEPVPVKMNSSSSSINKDIKGSGTGVKGSGTEAISPPPLKSGSVLDALKRPEYQIENIRKEAKKLTSPSNTPPNTKISSSNIKTTPILTKTTPLATPTSTWTCDECWVSNNISATACVACGATPPNEIKKKHVAFAVTSTASSGAPQGTSVGLKLGNTGPVIGSKGGNTSTGGVLGNTSEGVLGTSGGLKLSSGGLMSSSGGLKISSIESSSQANKSKEVTNSQKGIKLSSLVPPTTNWECPTCMISNSKDTKSCIACGTKQPNSDQSIPTTATSKGPLLSISGGQQWECPTCMCMNAMTHKKCPACETNQPGLNNNGGDNNKSKGVGEGNLQFGSGGGLKINFSLPGSDGNGLTGDVGSGSGGFKLGGALGGAPPTSGGFKLGGALGGATPSSGGFKLGGALGGATPSSGGFKMERALGGDTISSGGFKMERPLAGAIPTTGGFKLGGALGGATTSSDQPSSSSLTPSLATTASSQLLGQKTTLSVTTQAPVLNIPKPNISNLSGLKFQAPPPPVTTTPDVSSVPSLTLPTTSIAPFFAGGLNKSLVTGTATPPTTSVTPMFGGGTNTPSLLFPSTNTLSSMAPSLGGTSTAPVPSMAPSFGNGLTAATSVSTTAPSIGTTSTAPMLLLAPVSSTSLIASTAQITTSIAPIFGGGNNGGVPSLAPAVSSSLTPSIFGTISSNNTAVSSSVTPSIFSSSTSSSTPLLGGGNTPAAVTSMAPLFGGNKGNNNLIFGQGNNNRTGSPLLFGATQPSTGQPSSAAGMTNTGMTNTGMTNPGGQQSSSSGLVLNPSMGQPIPSLGQPIPSLGQPIPSLGQPNALGQLGQPTLGQPNALGQSTLGQPNSGVNFMPSGGNQSIFKPSLPQSGTFNFTPSQQQAPSLFNNNSSGGPTATTSSNFQIPTLGGPLGGSNTPMSFPPTQTQGVPSSFNFGQFPTNPSINFANQQSSSINAPFQFKGDTATNNAPTQQAIFPFTGQTGQSGLQTGQSSLQTGQMGLQTGGNTFSVGATFKKERVYKKATRRNK